MGHPIGRGSDSPGALREAIAAACERAGPLRIMEVCGTHTVGLHRSGVKSMLPASLRLISGPGCPVCVSSQGYIDAACALASRPGVVVCTYGDMMRVPGRSGSLESQRVRGNGSEEVLPFGKGIESPTAKATGHPPIPHPLLRKGWGTRHPPFESPTAKAMGHPPIPHPLLGKGWGTRTSTSGRVQVVYSALDAVRLAVNEPELEVVLLAVGFETTAPGHAVAVLEAERRGLKNFSLLAAQKQVIPAMEALLEAGDVGIDGFLCPGHVSVIIGSQAYRPIAERYRKPCVVAGFEPVQMLKGLLRIVEQVAAGEARVENVYSAAVTEGGNAAAARLLNQVFEPGEATWRAMGSIPGSGLVFREEYRSFDALERFGLEIGEDYDPPGCRCGEVIQGKVEPMECPLFATRCTPTEPVGPCMVSGEGTCAAAFKYGRGGMPFAGRCAE